MTNEKKMTFLPAVYAVPKMGQSKCYSLPAASPDNIPLYTAPLPQSFATWAQDDQFAFVKDKVREHYTRNQGLIPFMGPIVAYALHRSPDEPPISLTVYGVPFPPSEAPQLPQITLAAHEWRITQRFFLNSICSKDENTFH